MRKLITIAMLLFFFSTHQLTAQQQLKIDEHTIIKDADGKLIDLVKLRELMQSGKWTIKPVQDEDGNCKELHVIKRTGDSMLKMEKKNVGQKAPDFHRKDQEGKLISTEKAKGKILVLNFWFTTCKPCIAEIPELNHLYNEYKKNPDVIFASITFSTSEQIKSFTQKREVNYPIISDAEDICNQYGINGFPTTVIIDQEGKIADKIMGGRSDIEKVIQSSVEKLIQ